VDIDNEHFLDEGIKSCKVAIVPFREILDLPGLQKEKVVGSDNLLSPLRGVAQRLLSLPRPTTTYHIKGKSWSVLVSVCSSSTIPSVKVSLLRAESWNLGDRQVHRPHAVWGKYGLDFCNCIA
jgi:hypothetical protein